MSDPKYKYVGPDSPLWIRGQRTDLRKLTDAEAKQFLDNNPDQKELFAIDTPSTGTTATVKPTDSKT